MECYHLNIHNLIFTRPLDVKWTVFNSVLGYTSFSWMDQIFIVMGYRNWPPYSLPWSGWYCYPAQHELCRSSRSHLQPLAAMPAGTMSALPDSSTNHDSTDHISGQFLFYHDHNLKKSMVKLAFSMPYTTVRPHLSHCSFSVVFA